MCGAGLGCEHSCSLFNSSLEAFFKSPENRSAGMDIWYRQSLLLDFIGAGMLRWWLSEGLSSSESESLLYFAICAGIEIWSSLFGLSTFFVLVLVLTVPDDPDVLAPACSLIPRNLQTAASASLALMVSVSCR